MPYTLDTLVAKLLELKNAGVAGDTVVQVTNVGGHRLTMDLTAVGTHEYGAKGQAKHAGKVVVTLFP
jgi:hypothetical protein